MNKFIEKERKEEIDNIVNSEKLDIRTAMNILIIGQTVFNNSVIKFK